jgi:hypothetical protein
MPVPSKNYYCIHGIHAKEVCRDCENDLKAGWITERKVYHKQGLWKRRKRLLGCCRECGKKRGKSKFTQFCETCGIKKRDRERALIDRKKNNGVA